MLVDDQFLNLDRPPDSEVNCHSLNVQCNLY